MNVTDGQCFVVTKGVLTLETEEGTLLSVEVEVDGTKIYLPNGEMFLDLADAG